MLELGYKNRHKHGLVQFKMPLKSRTKTNDEKKKTVQTTASAKGINYIQSSQHRQKGGTVF